MKVTVIKIDESVIYNGVIYKHGQSFEVDDLIGKSLMERGYVAAEGDVQEKSGHFDEAQLREMPYPSLKRLAADLGVSAVGNKETLIARICAVEVNCEATSEDAEDFEEEETSDEFPITDMPE